MLLMSVLSQISNCQSLGRKNKYEILKTDRTTITDKDHGAAWEMIMMISWDDRGKYVLLYSIRYQFCSILLCSILFYLISILFYSIMFYSILFYSTLPIIEHKGLHGGEQRVRVGDCLRGGASWKAPLR